MCCGQACALRGQLLIPITPCQSDNSFLLLAAGKLYVSEDDFQESVPFCHGVWGTQTVRFPLQGYPAGLVPSSQEPDLWAPPCLLSTHVGVSTAMYSTSFLLRVQGSKPSHRECFSFSVYECACQCVWLAEGLFSTVALVKVCMVNSKVDFKSK